MIMILRRNDEDFVISESGNWNVAADFSKIKIMKLLARCDVYEDIALYGYDTIEEEISNMGNNNDQLKVMGLKRLVNDLIKIIQNSQFAMKKGKSSKRMGLLLEKLKKLYPMLNSLYRITSSVKTHSKTFKIIPEKYDIFLNLIQSIKSRINYELNENDLIFTHTEDFDPSEYKNKIKKQMTTKG